VDEVFKLVAELTSGQIAEDRIASKKVFFAGF
jgi:hypothetical protein